MKYYKSEVTSCCVSNIIKIEEKWILYLFIVELSL